MNNLSRLALATSLISLGAVGYVGVLISQLKRSTDRLLQEHPFPQNDHALEPQIEQAFHRLEAVRKKALTSTSAPFSQRMDIVGFVDQDFAAQDNYGGSTLQDSRLIEIPAGTTQIIPSITYFDVKYGAPNEHPDHHLYNLDLGIDVIIQDQVSAQATASWYLTDGNFNNRWGAAMSVRFLCLVPHV